MGKYFDKFPIINYANSACVNITERVTILPPITDASLVYYPWAVKNNMRADVVSYHYYDDADYDWLIWLSNGIIDPYYQWPMGTDEFNDFIVSKYGDISTAQAQIVWYKNNWETNSSQMDPSFYSALPANLRKYWNPVLGNNGAIVGYVRAPSSTTIATNQIVQLGVTLQSNLVFQQSEQVVVVDTGVNIGAGFVTYFDGANTMSVQHVSGNLQGSAATIVTGQTSGATANVQSNTVLINAIDPTEIVYWEPVYAFDVETQYNENNKNIKLLDNRYTQQVDSQMSQVLAS
jgi:hypothetical protein